MDNIPENKDAKPKQTKKVDAALPDETNARVSTRTLSDTDYEEGVPKWGSARFNGNLVLDVLETDESFVFDAQSVGEIIIGRKDPHTNDKPDVDLANSNAQEKGVSRRHAVVLNRDGALHIVDNGSANGTFLNGQRLVPNQSRILRDGDDVRLGHLVVRVTFRPA